VIVEEEFEVQVKPPVTGFFRGYLPLEADTAPIRRARLIELQPHREPRVRPNCVSWRTASSRSGLPPLVPRFFEPLF
jgi:hypothetical protein